MLLAKRWGGEGSGHELEGSPCLRRRLGLPRLRCQQLCAALRVLPVWRGQVALWLAWCESVGRGALDPVPG